MQSQKHNHSDNNSDFPSRILRTIGIDMQAHRPTTERLSRKTLPLSANHAGELRSAGAEPDGSSTPTIRQILADNWYKLPTSSPLLWNETLAFATDG